MHTTTSFQKLTESRASAAFAVGLGVWLTERLAFDLRVSTETLREPDGRLFMGFMGPALQIWLTDHAWLGTGIGVGVLDIDWNAGGPHFEAAGWRAELRLGYTLVKYDAHALNVALAVSPGGYTDSSYVHSTMATSIAAMVGYQHL